ncbi:MAG: hypothetical protein EZS28_017656 [Streblomastix strix]|uniref:Uncharacterized protein n=1 Tax=Streblomastix strix TaxID=222440 RepID=A0A5J4VWA0_9EUKA|nr:MAG: hypothetical protein EZS28_017656 [Streblomastix strix]
MESSCISCNYNLDYLFGSKGIYYYPLEISNDPNAIDEILEITLFQNKNNSHLKFKTISGAVNYGKQFCSFLGTPLTIVDTYLHIGPEVIKASNITLQGKAKLTDIANQSTILSSNTSNSIFIITGTNNTLRWLTFERNSGSTANILIEVISNSVGSLIVDGCILNDLNTESSSKHDFSFIQTSGSTTTIINSVFNGGKFVNGSALSIDSQQFNVIVNSNDFRNNTGESTSAGAIRTTNNESKGVLSVQYNQFVNNSGTRAGAIFIGQSSESPRFKIQYNIFSNITANSKEELKSLPNDILILAGSLSQTNDNYQNKENRTDAQGLQAGKQIIIINAYTSTNRQTYLNEVYVNNTGINPINDPDSGTIVGSSDNPLKTIDYAVNQKDRVGDLTLILYRQIYPLQSPLWINDDNVYIKDEEQYQNEYEYIDKSVISSTVGSSNAFSIKEGSLVLNAINIDATSFISRFVLVYITGQGSLYNINTITSTGSSSSSLIDINLNSNSKFEIRNSIFNAPYLKRYITIKIDNKPQYLNISKVYFSSIGNDSNARIAQISGAEIIPELVFKHISIPNSTSYSPLLQIPAEKYSGEFDNLILAIKWTNQEQFYLLPKELSSSQIINNKITYIANRYVFQTDFTAQLIAVNESHLTIRGVTFVQQATGKSVIQVNSANAYLILEDVGFLIASQKLFETGFGNITSSQERKDVTKFMKSNSKINYDYYMRNLQKASSAQVLSNPFVNVESGYSISLSNIKFGEWIASSDKPLINVINPVQHALIENIQIKHIGRQYGGPHILNLNIYPTGEAEIKNVSIDGRGWVHERDLRETIKNKNELVNMKKIGTCMKDNSIYNIDEFIDNIYDIDIPEEFKWKFPAIKVKGGNLRIESSSFVGLGVDGALVLEDVVAKLENSTRFEKNEVYDAAKEEGRKKKKIPSELTSAKDENKDYKVDENDRRFRELHRYRGYQKNLYAQGKTTVYAWNVSFIGEKHAKEKKAYKKGYPLWIQHGHESKLIGEIGQSNNAFVESKISKVNSYYLKGTEKDIGDGKIEKLVEIEIKTKGNLIPGVEWFVELQNKKDPEDNKRTLHYNLLHRKVWEEATAAEKNEEWYISEDENKAKNQKTTSNSYPVNEFGGKVFVRWLSEKVILLRLAHTELKPDEKSNADGFADPDSDRYAKDWKLRLGIEKRADQEGQATEAKIQWKDLKWSLSVGQIVGIAVGCSAFIILIIIILEEDLKEREKERSLRLQQQQNSEDDPSESEQTDDSDDEEGERKQLKKSRVKKKEKTKQKDLKTEQKSKQKEIQMQKVIQVEEEEKSGEKQRLIRKGEEKEKEKEEQQIKEKDKEEEEDDEEEEEDDEEEEEEEEEDDDDEDKKKEKEKLKKDNEKEQQTTAAQKNEPQKSKKEEGVHSEDEHEHDTDTNTHPSKDKEKEEQITEDHKSESEEKNEAEAVVEEEEEEEENFCDQRSFNLQREDYDENLPQSGNM